MELPSFPIYAPPSHGPLKYLLFLFLSAYYLCFVGVCSEATLVLVQAVQLAQRSEAVNVGNMNVSLKEQENKVKLLEAEVKQLRGNKKTMDVSSEVLQLKREFLNLQKRVDSLTSSSQSSR